MPIKRLFAILIFLFFSQAHAFFFILPIPNISKPPTLQSLIDALEKSSDTKAVAFVSEDKLLARKVWVWGHFAGTATQEEANARAIRACEANLQKAKAQQAGGQPIYTFGEKRCELHDFTNKTVKLPAPLTPQSQPASSQASTSSPGNPSGEVRPEVARPGSESGQPDVTSRVSAPPAANSGATTSGAESGNARSEMSIEAKLRQLRELLDRNLISREEYELKRKQLIDSM